MDAIPISHLRAAFLPTGEVQRIAMTDIVERLMKSWAVENQIDVVREAADEIKRLRSELATFRNSYLEISQIVGRQGSEAHSLADDVRRAINERGRPGWF